MKVAVYDTIVLGFCMPITKDGGVRFAHHDAPAPGPNLRGTSEYYALSHHRYNGPTKGAYLCDLKNLWFHHLLR